MRTGRFRCLYLLSILPYFTTTNIPEMHLHLPPSRITPNRLADNRKSPRGQPKISLWPESDPLVSEYNAICSRSHSLWRAPANIPAAGCRADCIHPAIPRLTPAVLITNVCVHPRSYPRWSGRLSAMVREDIRRCPGCRLQAGLRPSPACLSIARGACHRAQIPWRPAADRVEVVFRYIRGSPPPPMWTSTATAAVVLEYRGGYSLNCLLIPESDYQRLKRVSDELKTTPSEVIRTSIEEFLNKYEKKEQGLQVEIRQLVQQEVKAALRKREEESNKSPLTSISLIKQRRKW